MTRVAIVGASGYGGAELVRLLSNHSAVEIVAATSGRNAGVPLRNECPWLATDLVLSAFDPETADCDVVFLCQEAGFAMKHARTLVERGIRVIDLSADFRLQDLEAFGRYYKLEHADPELLKEAAYGLPELGDREAIRKARLVANPGCHVTAALLALTPILPSIPDGAVPVIDSKTGVSGAGRSRKETSYLFSELDGGISAYAVSGHRHTPEIEMLACCRVRFTPHLIPVPRGLVSTVHVPVSQPLDVLKLIRERYENEPMVRVLDNPPNSKAVSGTNMAHVWATYDEHTGMAVVISTIDNLGKGAAGQAVQNMNLMLGLPEPTGLPLSGMWP
ncbi:N-acetyl-gamma-glutamyl-phosphate reductase [bacterium]|nr:MAG: N-acetyl-gamma-glutamyl-phosphate reductase [bacterium]